jgi:hypothetical protein
VAVDLTLVQTKQKQNNTKKHGRNNTKNNKYKYTHYQNTHTLQNKLQQPQYKLKQTQYKIYPNESHNVIKYPQYKVTLINMFHTYKIPYEIWGSHDSDGGHNLLWYLLRAGAIIRIG